MKVLSSCRDLHQTRLTDSRGTTSSPVPASKSRPGLVSAYDPELYSHQFGPSAAPQPPYTYTDSYALLRSPYAGPQNLPLPPYKPDRDQLHHDHQPIAYQQPPLTAAAAANLPHQNYQPVGQQRRTGKPPFGWPQPPLQHSPSCWCPPTATPLPTAAVPISAPANGFVILRGLVMHSPPIGGFWKEDHPNENELLLVQDFFGYTEDVVTEGAADDTYIKMGPEKDNNEFIEKDIDSPQNDTSSGNREIFAGQVASGDVDFGKSYERIGGYGGPRGSFRCGFSNGDEGEGDHPRRPLDHRSRIGCDYESKREGAGCGTWGTWTDEMVNVAGGISCSFSKLLMKPIDAVKLQVRILSAVCGLYMGSIPERVGQFLSHGLQAGISEVTKIALLNVAHSISELLVESVESLLGTFLGTTKIGCEVLIQRW
ncbi:hypothetical protein SASPL_146708 [Salvia splendens]|uniref:Uncharacterized protein n=1 Tax=Salvia splendens TaxID=180675 RepID=A0A8X8Z5G1_SALSN|nr:hypothetical protein SASPL_146708 [Salvia splendens]